MMNDDMALVREYAAHNSEEAFAALVSRHVSLVHSVALRQTRDSHLAEEIVQTVFIILARKAGSLDSKTILPGWLYRTTNYVSAAALKIKRRCERREQEAYMQAMIEEAQTDSTWEQLSPLLDGAMMQLRESDRDILLLRFFQNKNFKEVGDALGVEERAAQKRVARALEKLRTIFVRRGVTSTTATLTGAISANSIQAAPAALIKTTTAVALAKGATASTSTLTIVKGTLKIMAWTKAKTAIAAGIGILLVVGIGTTTTALVAQHQHNIQTQTSFPRSSWANAGYADPQSALETIFWAQAQGDGKTYLASMTPDLQQRLEQQFAGQLSKQGMSLEELFTQKSKQHINAVTGFYIWGQQTVSNQLLLRVWIPGKGQNATFKMKKIGNEWKLDEEFLPDY